MSYIDTDSQSSDEESIGSLVDFIVEDTDEELSDFEETLDEESNSDIDISHVDTSLGTCEDESGIRRSTRTYKGVAPERYVDENYVDLMIEDDIEGVLLVLSDEVADGLEDNNTIENEDVEEYEYVSESDSDSTHYDLSDEESEDTS